MERVPAPSPNLRLVLVLHQHGGQMMMSLSASLQRSYMKFGTLKLKLQAYARKSPTSDKNSEMYCMVDG